MLAVQYLLIGFRSGAVTPEFKGQLATLRKMHDVVGLR